MKILANLVVFLVAAAGTIAGIAWMTLLPAIGLLWLAGWLS